VFTIALVVALNFYAQPKLGRPNSRWLVLAGDRPRKLDEKTDNRRRSDEAATTEFDLPEKALGALLRQNSEKVGIKHSQNMRFGEV
jgi:hypothetical protein